jgi:hypothetical protein
MPPQSAWGTETNRFTRTVGYLGPRVQACSPQGQQSHIPSWARRYACSHNPAHGTEEGVLPNHCRFAPVEGKPGPTEEGHAARHQHLRRQPAQARRSVPGPGRRQEVHRISPQGPKHPRRHGRAANHRRHRAGNRPQHRPGLPQPGGEPPMPGYGRRKWGARPPSTAAR